MSPAGLKARPGENRGIERPGEFAVERSKTFLSFLPLFRPKGEGSKDEQYLARSATICFFMFFGPFGRVVRF